MCGHWVSLLLLGGLQAALDPLKLAVGGLWILGSEGVIFVVCVPTQNHRVNH